MKAQQLHLFGAPLRGPQVAKTEAPAHHTPHKRPGSNGSGRLMLRELPTNERPLERLEFYGAGALSKAELIELVVNSQDSIGRLLVSRCGSLAGIAAMSLTELQEIPGIGKAKAAALKAALELGRRMTVENGNGDKAQVKSPADAANLVMAEMRGLDHEQLWVLLLDSKNRVQAIEKLYKGSLNTSLIRVGEIFTEAIRRKVAAVILVHNHPSGDPTPSPEDVKITGLIVQAGDLLDIEVLDHVVIGDQRWVSLKERGLGFN